MREWLFACAPLAVVIYFALYPDQLAVLLSEAKALLP